MLFLTIVLGVIAGLFRPTLKDDTSPQKKGGGTEKDTRKEGTMAEIKTYFRLKDGKKGLIDMIITNRPKEELGQMPLEEVDTGHYVPAYLLHLGSKGYSFVVIKTKLNPMASAPEHYTWALPYKGPYRARETFRYATEADQVSLYLKDPNGIVIEPDTFVNDPEVSQLVIGNGAKMGKRLKEVTKPVPFFGPVDADRIKVLSDPDNVVGIDGISAITRGLFVSLINDNPVLSNKAKARFIRGITKGKYPVVSLRATGPEGMIKGNALVVPDGQVGEGIDLLTFQANQKSEFNFGFPLVTVVPQHGYGQVVANDGFNAIWGHVKGMYHPSTLLPTFATVMEQTVADVEAGRVVHHLSSLADANTDGDIWRERDAIGSSVAEFDRLRLALYGVGLDGTMSQFIQFMEAGRVGATHLEKGRVRLRGDRDPAFLREGDNWLSKKNQLVAPWAVSCHIMTDEALITYGYDDDDDVKVNSFHKETQTFVVSGEEFNRLAKLLGGADLDDTVAVHLRWIDGKLVVVLLRNPSDWGEYAIIEVDEGILEDHPFFHTEGEIPEVKADEIMEDIISLEKTKKVTFGEVTKVNGLGEKYSLDDHDRLVEMAGVGAGVGTVSNAKWFWYSQFQTHIKAHKASNEGLIDTFQQGIGTVQFASEVKDWAAEVLATANQKLEQAGKVPDAYWDYHRGGSKARDVRRNAAKSPWVRLYRQREALVREAVTRLTTGANEVPVVPIGLEDFQVEDMAKAKAKVLEYKKLLTEALRHNTRATKLFSDTERVSWPKALVEKLMASDEVLGEEGTNTKVLEYFIAGLDLKANAGAGRANFDAWLFSVDHRLEVQPWEYFIRAYKARMVQLFPTRAEMLAAHGGDWQEDIVSSIVSAWGWGCDTNGSIILSCADSDD